jgi:hypothetical protein
MRTLFTLLVYLFATSCFALEAASPPPGPSRSAKPPMARFSVDLAKPGALDRLEETNPEHYAKVLAVKRVASQPNCVEELKVLRADLKLDDVTCAAMTTLTSYPPKRNVSVTIDGVHYMTYTPLGFAPARAVPLVASPKILPAP